ncbi:MAG TPA: phenylacetic acid degradation operon negative regulatory protein PaaX [Hyphomicrobiaceae bacterium]|jgi:phenylacetic acid degradation operon negative regulatory protein
MATTTSATTAARKLSALLQSFERRRPMRAGSLIVTIYGDAIVPRGGSLWLGSLLELMAGFGVEPGLVRTAASRLVADGWFERTRIGKQSYYRLSAWGAAEFAAATARIYQAAERPWSGEMEVAIVTTPDVAERAARRERLLRGGWGQAAANVMVRPHMETPAGRAAASDAGIVLVTRPQSAETARALARACWRLDDLAAAYAQFVRVFGPVAGEIAEGARLSDAPAFQLRTLLIHDWRRIVLRDPLLPRAMLPEGWPGLRALGLVSGVYPRILAASERWLGGHAINEDGPLPPATPALNERFRTA